MTPPPLPRPGDTILDPSGASNRVLQAQPAKLLLSDPDGFQFVLGRHRLGRGWTHRPVERKPRQRRPERLGRLPYIPRERRRAA